MPTQPFVRSHGPSDADWLLTDEQFRRFADKLSHIVWRMNPDGTRLIAPRWAEIAGVSEGDLQRDGWLQTIHSEDRLAVATALRTSRQYGSRFDAEYRLEHRDGSYHWVRSRGEPVRDSRGDIVAWIGVASNIDDQKRIEAVVRDNEARLRLIIDAARVGTIDHDLRSGKITASQTASALFGFSVDDDVTFEMVRERIYAADRPEFLRSIGSATAPDSNGVVDVAFRAVHPDGSLVWMCVRGTYLFEGTGQQRHAVRFVGVAGNLTGHMIEMAERAMLSTIISSSSDAIVATTCRGVITHWNAAAERIFGFTAAEMMGGQLDRLVPTESLNEFRSARDAVRRGDVISGTPMTWLRADGASLDVSVTFSPIKDDNASCIGLSAIVRDITRQRQLEAEVAQGQKMEAVGLLAGGIAHDLNNLLTSVLVGVELAESSPLLSAETRSEFGDMKHDCLRAAALIRQLLAIAKRQVINPRPCNSNELVHDLVPMVRGILGEDVLLTESLTATRGVYVDAAQIGQVIFNLAANARAAMPSGGTVTIETRDDLAAGTVIIEVTDSGTGMTPDVQARVFEPFFTTKPTGEGTGLGLSTSYGIVAQSHGQLTFESTPGAGTTFTITLPAVNAPTTAPAVVPESSESLGDETILVVEDDRVVRDVVVRGLSQHGFTLLEACNGADALAVMEAHAAPIHLVLTDVVMPTMSGAELVAHLRRWYPNIRVLFMSGYSSRAVETFGAIVPNTDLLVKPFDLARLIRTVRSVLDGPSQARSVCESCSAA